MVSTKRCCTRCRTEATMEPKTCLPIHQIDAFAERSFAGSPAAVMPLEEWLPDGLMQSITIENQLSETALFVPEGDGYRA